MNPHVMIVEDNAAAREMMSAVLGPAGFRISAVSNGEAALDLLNRSWFELVLLDVHMPRLSGLEVLEAIGRLSRKPPVLMVSANTQGETVRKAVSLGCIGYVAKPFLPGELIERARWALAGPVSMTMH